MIHERIATQSGSVQLIDVMGSPLSVVNSARVSMGRQADEMSEADWRLIDYLWSHEHTSPFRHVQFQFHVRAPVFVLRQWMKHQVGCAWNEISGRYVQFDHEAWSPQAWRAQAEQIKQGSAGPISADDALWAQMIYDRAIDARFKAYEELLRVGICKEQARACLPLSLMSECFWSCSLHALIHFLKLRLDHHAQLEIRCFAEAVRESVSAVEGMPRLLSIALA